MKVRVAHTFVEVRARVHWCMRRGCLELYYVYVFTDTSVYLSEFQVYRKIYSEGLNFKSSGLECFANLPKA